MHDQMTLVIESSVEASHVSLAGCLMAVSWLGLCLLVC
ncbi:putative membrane protein [Synechococcus sp. BIOS-E4-1]|nr:putative membrane protein [Synechococcus sp. BIOS-E4-1]